MFSLLLGLYSYLTERKQLNVLLIGLDGAGKTTLLENIKSFQYKTKAVVDASKIQPTIGLNVATVVMPPFIIKLWDLGGKINLRPIWKDYYFSSHGIIFLVNTFDRFEERKYEILDELQRLHTDNDVEGVPLLILLNYKDSAPNLIYYSEALQISKLVGRNVYLCAANVLDGNGIQDCFSKLVNDFKRGVREITSDDFV